MKINRIVSIVIITSLLLSGVSISLASLRSSHNIHSTDLESDRNPSTVDNITIEISTDKERALEEVADGGLDIFLTPVKGKTIDNLDDETKENIDTWKDENSYHTLYFNPAHTVSPYEVITDDGKYKFNPFAIEKVRYAVNFLINRSKIVEDIYDGDGGPRFLPFSRSSPSYDHFKDIVGDNGFTAEGNKQKGIEMIQKAMIDAKNDLELKGELRTPENSSSDYWSYKPPNGDFENLELRGFARSEDQKEKIGDYFSELLKDVNLKPDIPHHFPPYQSIVWSSDPADLRWNFYVGRWFTSSAYYQSKKPAEMYAGWQGYMPGGFVPNADYRYGYYEDGASWDAEGDHGEFYGNQTLERISKRLYKNQIEDIDRYWEYMERATRIGVKESVRIFLGLRNQFYAYNKDNVDTAVTDVITGWDDYFTPRTIYSSKERLKIAQYSSQGTLYAENWNEIGGSGDYHGLQQKRMLMDPGAALHPRTGKPISFRCDWKAKDGKNQVEKDYHWYKNETGSMVLDKNISVPSDAVIYNTSSNQWENIGSDTRSAVKVTYDVKTGKWHDGHDLTIKDLMANYAFMKELAYKDGENDAWYNDELNEDAKPWYDSIVATQWDEQNGTYSIWGDFTSLIDGEIGKYYTEYTFPVVPHQLYEAAQFLVTQNETFIPSNTGEYNWQNTADHWIHWLSRSQGKDFVSTLENMTEKGWIPWYLREENKAPITISQNQYNSEINSLINFYEKYEHVFSSQGPFMLKSVNTEKMYVNMTRFDKEDGYPFSKDYYREFLESNRLNITSMESPEEVTKRQDIEVSVKCEIIEDYPNGTARDLTKDDNYTVELLLLNDTGEVVANITPVLTDGVFTGTFETKDLDFRMYTIKFTGTTPGMIGKVSKTREVILEPILPNIPINNFEVNTSTVIPDERVNITATAYCNNYPGTVEVYVEDELINTYNITPGEEIKIEEEYTFTSVGNYTVSLGYNYQKTVNVVEPIMIEYIELSSEEIIKGETVSLTAEITNNDDEDRTVDIEIDGDTAETLTVNPGTHTYTQEIKFDETGTYTVSVGNQDTEINVVDAIVIESADLAKDEVVKGKDVKITAEITNNDDIERDVTIKIDGEMVESLSVEPGTNTYTYKHTFDEKGTYEVTVGDMKAGDVKVKEETSGFGLILLVLSLSLIAVYMYRKKQ